jgi:hypothetical protein
VPNDPSSWRSPELFDPLALIQSAVDNAIDTPLALCSGNVPLISDGDLLLPPICGGQLPGFLEDAWDWTKGNLMDPAGNFFRDILAEVGRTVAGAVNTILLWILKPMYTLIRLALWPGIPTDKQRYFPSASQEDTRPPWDYLARIPRMLWYVLAEESSEATSWVWDQIKVGLGYAGRGFGSLGDLVWSGLGGTQRVIKDALSEATSWVWDQIKVGLGYAGRGFGSLGELVWSGLSGTQRVIQDALSEATSWVWNQAKGLPGEILSAVSRMLDDGWNWLRVNVLDKVADGVIAGAQAIGGAIQDAFEWLINNAFEPFADLVARKLAIPGKLIRAEYKSLSELVDDMMDPPRALMEGIAGLLMIPALFGAFVSVVMGGISGPLTEPVLQEYRRMVGVAIPPYDVLRDAYLRNELTGEQVDDALGRAGFDFTNRKAMFALFNQIPNASDLVRFGVREVFTPEIAERFGQFEEFPSGFGDAMALLGYGGPRAAAISGGLAPGGKTWAEAYWAAHWDLPSVSQAFEMFHRQVKLPDGSTFDDAALDRLLRALDMMPYWRDPIKQTTYNLPTRVDLRRLYKIKKYSEKDVYNVYRASGYDETVSEALTEFTKQYYSPDEADQFDEYKDVTAAQIRLAYRRHVIPRAEALDLLIDADYLPDTADFLLAIDDAQLALNPGADADVDVREITRTVILDAYSEGLWDRARAQSELEVQGYLPTSADLLLSLEDIKLARSLTSAQTDLVRQRYITYDIDDTQARQELEALGTVGLRQDLLIAEWAVDRQAGTRTLSVTDLRRAYTARLITEDDLVAGILRLGYNARDAGLLFTLT